MERALAMGRGWGDLVGGGIEGVKLTTTLPGAAPGFTVRFVPGDVVDPALNGGLTLLMYTGVIPAQARSCNQVVKGFLNRDRRIMQALAASKTVAESMEDVMSRKDPEAFGYYLGEAWRLEKEMCPDGVDPLIEEMVASVGSHIFGARTLGTNAFLLMACRSASDANEVRRRIEAHPPNERARFLGFEVSSEGVVVTSP